MDCPTKEILQDLVDGELPQDKIPEVTAHIKSCETCKSEFKEILALYEALSETVEQEQCPSKDILANYSQKNLSTQEMATVQKHIEFCSRCKSYVWMFGASESELAEWEENEKLSYQKFLAEDLGYGAAKEILSKLLPSKIEYFDKIWESVLNLVLDIKNKAPEQWPVFGSPGQLAGVLGFSEASDPESAATSVILSTTLLVAQKISDGEIKATPEEIRTAVQDAAKKFGAGKELQKRLMETVPEILQRSHS